ncbi:hypothetical protein NP493_275g03002 [Ridgeia piscesae]|uniref:Uncharacterized protein n=1 Tax=Ridgeia piscesae TaxID=27915 RepID=A0AAD9NXE1_RIDPI|nr:hypothetical protein NP493_275g03002 [Ridgeia piscesae]
MDKKLLDVPFSGKKLGRRRHSSAVQPLNPIIHISHPNVPLSQDDGALLKSSAATRMAATTVPPRPTPPDHQKLAQRRESSFVGGKVAQLAIPGTTRSGARSPGSRRHSVASTTTRDLSMSLSPGGPLNIDYLSMPRTPAWHPVSPGSSSMRSNWSELACLDRKDSIGSYYSDDGASV